MSLHEEQAPSVLPPVGQAVWGTLAVMNFTCGGAGTGAVLGVLGTALLADVPAHAVRLVEVVALVLSGLGFAAVGMEAGRPLRGINVFRHLHRSWMSREALAAAAFGALIALDVVMPGPWQRGLGATAALAFMLSQGFILFAARGVPAWATWEVPTLFITSGLTKGLGITLVVLAALGGSGAMTTAGGLAVGVILLDLLAWLGYVGSREGTPAKLEGLARLRTGWVAAGIIGLGHLLPLAALVVLLWAGGSWPAALGGVLTTLAGLGMTTGGAILKWAVVRRAGLLHPIALNVMRSISRPIRAVPASDVDKSQRSAISARPSAMGY